MSEEIKRKRGRPKKGEVVEKVTTPHPSEKLKKGRPKKGTQLPEHMEDVHDILKLIQNGDVLEHHSKYMRTVYEAFLEEALDEPIETEEDNSKAAQIFKSKASNSDKFRYGAAVLLNTEAMPRLMMHLRDPALSTRDLIAIVKLLRDSAYGMPAVMEYSNPLPEDAGKFQPIIISNDLLEMARKNDEEHLKINKKKGSEDDSE